MKAYYVNPYTGRRHGRVSFEATAPTQTTAAVAAATFGLGLETEVLDESSPLVRLRLGGECCLESAAAVFAELAEEFPNETFNVVFGGVAVKLEPEYVANGTRRYVSPASLLSLLDD